jgi:hypothetical protein
MRWFQHWQHTRWSVVLGGVVVIVLTTGPKFRGFKPVRGHLYLRATKIRSTSSRREAKPSAPCRKILRHVKRSLRSMKEILSRQNEQSSGCFDKHKNKGFIFITLGDLLYWSCSYKIHDTAYVRVSLQLNTLWRTVKHDFRGFSSKKKVLDAEERARTMTIGSK